MLHSKWRDAMAVYGYARGSTGEQSLDNQLATLKAAGAEKVFAEKVSGAKTDRRALRQAVACLSPGDTLLVTRIDRLARSTRDLLNVLDTVAKAGASFKSLSEGWADTSSATGSLVLQILASIAEFERKLIKQRCDEGRANAKVRGVKFGRKPKLTKHQRSEALERRDAGETLTAIA